MASGILHQRLNHHGRHENVANVFVDDLFKTKPIAKANSLDGQVMVQKRKLLEQRNQLTLVRVQAQAKEASEMLDHVACANRIGLDLRRDCVQRIEKKMRLQLHSKRVQTSLGEVPFQPLQAQLTGNIVLVIVMCLPGSQNQPIDEPVPEKHASQRIGKNPDTSKAAPFIHPEGGANCPQKINVHRRHQQAGKQMRENSSGKLLAGIGDLPVHPKDERCDL